MKFGILIPSIVEVVHSQFLLQSPHSRGVNSESVNGKLNNFQHQEGKVYERGPSKGVLEKNWRGLCPEIGVRFETSVKIVYISILKEI